ncbi:MAG: 2-C-methyl-D-erythritol 4-phosphate cytidylyltransferase [Puniceicoccales bacterium]|jgi:2-C-methyl-D-erythritol 4-phosphate cytidylyltransferase|nr:2-C-methyl-D-erythritol 4-phosphate cytidylyltransferase [Puniceicoccales bacterium]
MERYAIFLCAGRSQRFGEGDKCLALIRGKPILSYAFEAFVRTGIFDRYIFVHRDNTQKNILEKYFQDRILGNILSRVRWVLGGENRTNSVFNGLQLIREQLSSDAFVFIHDGARPLISSQNILRINGALSKECGVILAHRTTDTILLATAKDHVPFPPIADKIVFSKEQRQYCDRGKLWAIETPQAFYFPEIFKDYEQAHALQRSFSDDSSLFSGEIRILESKDFNPKITFVEDLEPVNTRLVFSE